MLNNVLVVPYHHLLNHQMYTKSKMSSRCVSFVRIHHLFVTRSSSRRRSSGRGIWADHYNPFKTTVHVQARSFGRTRTRKVAAMEVRQPTSGPHEIRLWGAWLLTLRLRKRRTVAQPVA
ncbi:hypothetical protein V8E55_007471 [Tylopilus felleus]